MLSIDEVYIMFTIKLITKRIKIVYLLTKVVFNIILLIFKKLIVYIIIGLF